MKATDTIAFINSLHNNRLLVNFPQFGVGYANGYVAVNKVHPAFGLTYDELEEKYGINVHGGVTFSEYLSPFICKFLIPYQDDGPLLDINTDVFSTSEPTEWWCFGFDTCHGWENTNDQNLIYVNNETNAFRNQLIEIAKK